VVVAPVEKVCRSTAAGGLQRDVAK
jgi:hypothetical protein